MTRHTRTRSSLVQPTNGMQHFTVHAPLSTHWRKVTCRETECSYYVEGWKTVVPAIGPQADYIRYKSGRHFTETRVGDGLTEFSFPPGQEAGGFHAADHYLPLDRQEIYVGGASRVLRGPRGQFIRPDGGRGHVRPQDWTEHMNEETDKARRERE